MYTLLDINVYTHPRDTSTGFDGSFIILSELRLASLGGVDAFFRQVKPQLVARHLAVLCAL